MAKRIGKKSGKKPLSQNQLKKAAGGSISLTVKSFNIHTNEGDPQQNQTTVRTFGTDATKKNRKNDYPTTDLGQAIKTGLSGYEKTPLKKG